MNGLITIIAFAVLNTLFAIYNVMRDAPGYAAFSAAAAGFGAGVGMCLMMDRRTA